MAVFIAMIFDGLDGRVARLTSTETAFGKEYDSLADMVAFGLAPAIVSYQWGVARIAEYGKAWYRFGWLAAFFYAVAAALRLAKFNSRVQDKRYFEGLPSPSAAAVVAAFLWMSSEWREPGLPGTDPRLRDHRGGRRADGEPLLLSELQGLRSDAAGALHLAGGGGAGVHRHRPGARRSCCWSIFGGYALWAPLVWVWRRLRRSQRQERSTARRAAAHEPARALSGGPGARRVDAARRDGCAGRSASAAIARLRQRRVRRRLEPSRVGAAWEALRGRGQRLHALRAVPDAHADRVRRRQSRAPSCW